MVFKLQLQKVVKLVKLIRLQETKFESLWKQSGTIDLSGHLDWIMRLYPVQLCQTKFALLLQEKEWFVKSFSRQIVLKIEPFIEEKFCLW